MNTELGALERPNPGKKVGKSCCLLFASKTSDRSTKAVGRLMGLSERLERKETRKAQKRTKDGTKGEKKRVERQQNDGRG